MPEFKNVDTPNVNLMCTHRVKCHGSEIFGEKRTCRKAILNK